MKIHISTFLLLFLILISSSCRKSVLSELDLESVSVLKVKVKIDEKRKGKRQVLVSIRDKTNHPVEFSNGDVFVNGDPTDFSLRTVLSTSRGYYYRTPGDIHEFAITIQWNKTESYSFMVDQNAGFPGFGNSIGWNISKGTKKFTITPAPFANNKIEVEYDVMK